MILLLAFLSSVLRLLCACSAMKILSNGFTRFRPNGSLCGFMLVGGDCGKALIFADKLI